MGASKNESFPVSGLNDILINMGESLNGLLDSSVNGTVGEQRRPGRHPATARMMWSKDVNKVVMECYLKSKPVNENGVPIRGYRQGMFRVWQEIGLFESTEQRICDQARAKRKKRETYGPTIVAMAWIDYRMAYDMVPRSWIEECLEMFGIAVNVRQFLLSSMKKWKTELTSCGQQWELLTSIEGYFRETASRHYFFVLCMVPLSFVLRRSRAGYEWGGREFKINHLLFTDDLKLFGKSYEQIDSLVQTVHTFSTDIGMEFGIKKCGVLVLKRGKIVKMEGVVLPDGQVMKEIENKGYRYLGILKTDRLKEKEMKDLFSNVG